MLLWCIRIWVTARYFSRRPFVWQLHHNKLYSNTLHVKDPHEIVYLLVVRVHEILSVIPSSRSILYLALRDLYYAVALLLVKHGEFCRLLLQSTKFFAYFVPFMSNFVVLLQYVQHDSICSQRRWLHFESSTTVRVSSRTIWTMGHSQWDGSCKAINQNGQFKQIKTD